MTTTPAAVRDLPPSAKLVYKTLEYEGPMTQGELATETLLPARTVRDALSRLRAAGLVEERVYIPDARKSTYTLADCTPEQPA